MVHPNPQRCCSHPPLALAATRSRDPYTRAVDTFALFGLAQFWAYRLGAYVVLNVLDDPAWLAFIFC